MVRASGSGSSKGHLSIYRYRHSESLLLRFLLNDRSLLLVRVVCPLCPVEAKISRMASFDPYHIWLGIPPQEQPASHYRLLAIPELESNPDVIDAAAEQRTIYLRTFQTGDQAELAEQLLNEVSAARICLLDVEQKAKYDQQLQVEMQPALTSPPALVENDPLGIADLQPTAAVRQPSRRTEAAQPIWQQRRILAAAGAVAVVLLFIFLNSGGGPQVPNTDNAEERKAEGSRLVEERAKQELAQAEQERLAKEKAEAERLAAVEKAAAEKLASLPKRKSPISFGRLDGNPSITREDFGLVFSPDGNQFATIANNVIRIVDVSSNLVTSEFKHEPVEGRPTGVIAVSFSPDGEVLVSGNRDNTLKVWDRKTERLTHTFRGHTDQVRSLAFSSDGSRLVSGSRDKTVRTWDMSSGKTIKLFTGHSGVITSVVFSIDGSRIVSGSDDSTVTVWDAHSGKAIYTFKGHAAEVRSIAVSNDNRRVFSAGHDKVIRIWNINTGEQERVLEGHASWVLSLTISACGRFLISGSYDNTVKIWDLSNGTNLQTLNQHQPIYVEQVATSPNGKWILSSSPGIQGKTIVWKVLSSDQQDNP
jgi:hypothetical protein